MSALTISSFLRWSSGDLKTHSVSRTLRLDYQVPNYCLRRDAGSSYMSSIRNTAVCKMSKRSYVRFCYSSIYLCEYLQTIAMQRIRIFTDPYVSAQPYESIEREKRRRPISHTFFFLYLVRESEHACDRWDVRKFDNKNSKRINNVCEAIECGHFHLVCAWLPGCHMPFSVVIILFIVGPLFIIHVSARIRYSIER